MSKPLPSSFNSHIRQLAQTAHDLSLDYVYSTGYITERELDAIAGLLSIGQLWVIEGGKLKAVLPKGLKKVDGLDSRADTYALEIEVTRALTPRNYTPEPQDAATDPTPYWLEDDNSVWNEPVGNWENP